MTSSVSHKLFIVPETVYGVTPVTPAFVEIPITGCTLGLTKNTIQSNTIRSDRQIADFRDGTQQTGGDINCELQFDALDDLIEAALCGTWAANVLEVDTARRSFTVLREFTDLTAAEKPFEIYTGVEIINMALQVSTDAAVTANFTTLGKGVVSSGTAPSGATFTAAAAGNVFDSFTGSLTEGGAALGVATELGLTLENGSEARFVIGSNQTIQPKIGNSNLTGQLGAYFEDHNLLDKFYLGTKSSVAVTLEDPAGNAYTIEVPKIHFTGGQPDVEGSSDIILSMPFQALLDSAAGTNLKITRAAA